MDVDIKLVSNKY